MNHLAALFVQNWVIFVAPYALGAGAAFALLWLARPARLHARKLQRRHLPRGQLAREIGASLASSTVFVGVGLLTLLAEGAGYTRGYRDMDTFGATWLALSIVLMLLIHDAYFYWAHRLMHRVGALWRTHRFHHRFRMPTPWSAFSFHPSEALIEAGVFPLIALLLPAHPLALLCFTTLATVWSAWIHCGHELLPERSSRHPLGRWLMRTSLHDLHHQGSDGNYGLYFTIWDEAMGTLVQEIAPQHVKRRAT